MNNNSTIIYLLKIILMQKKMEILSKYKIIKNFMSLMRIYVKIKLNKFHFNNSNNNQF